MHMLDPSIWVNERDTFHIEKERMKERERHTERERLNKKDEETGPLQRKDRVILETDWQVLISPRA